MVQRTHSFILLLWVLTATPIAFALALPGIGASIDRQGIRVTLLSAGRLTLDEYVKESGNSSPRWAGGGLRIAFLVENRDGAPSAPALGDITVLVDGHRYNPVANVTSTAPFAPDVSIRTADDFFTRDYGRPLGDLAPTLTETRKAEALEVFIRGGSIPFGVPVVIELEQAETFRQDSRGRLRKLTPEEIAASWMTFTFNLASLD
jgi:hypothetical protein